MLVSVVVVDVGAVEDIVPPSLVLVADAELLGVDDSVMEVEVLMELVEDVSAAVVLVVTAGVEVVAVEVDVEELSGAVLLV